jgi:hypothetical protein
MNQDQSKTDGAAPVSSTPLLCGVAARKLRYLQDRSAKITKVRVDFEMPCGDEGTLDSFGRCEWTPETIRPGILSNELARLFTA